MLQARGENMNPGQARIHAQDLWSRSALSTCNICIGCSANGTASPMSRVAWSLAISGYSFEYNQPVADVVGDRLSADASSSWWPRSCSCWIVSFPIAVYSAVAAIRRSVDYRLHPVRLCRPGDAQLHAWPWSCCTSAEQLVRPVDRWIDGPAVHGPAVDLGASSARSWGISGCRSW